jgi:hypothetical protein
MDLRKPVIAAAFPEPPIPVINKDGLAGRLVVLDGVEFGGALLRSDARPGDAGP